MSDQTSTNPAADGAAAARADDAERVALKAAGKPAPKALTGARGRVAAAKAAKARKAPAKAAKGAKGAKARKAPARAAKAAPPAKGRPAKADGAPSYRGIWADAAEAAAKGKLPPAPDFSAATHAPYRKRLAALTALVKAADLKALVAHDLPRPVSSSPKALHRYRDIAVLALKARG